MGQALASSLKVGSLVGSKQRPVVEDLEGSNCAAQVAHCGIVVLPVMEQEGNYCIIEGTHAAEEGKLEALANSEEIREGLHAAMGNQVVQVDFKDTPVS